MIDTPHPAKAPECIDCGDTGLLLTIDSKGNRASRICECQRPKEIGSRLARAGIPANFAAASFSTYFVTPATAHAHRAAARYVEEFIPKSTTTGLLFTGSVGTGKTHLAVAITRALIMQKGITVAFVHVGTFLDELRATFESDKGEPRANLWRRIFDADLVVLDELGASKVSDFVFETIEALIGTLYNRSLPTVVTTNFANIGQGASDQANSYARAARPDTLGDRVGARMFSRLQQMCAPIRIDAPDWRARK